MPEVVIPYAPRPLQLAIHQALDDHRFAAVVCHRRFGKSVLAINHLIKGALTCTKLRPRFAYIGPTYRMAKQTVWDYLMFYCRPIPGVTFNQSELRADFPNGGQVRVYGGDNPDSLRGLYLDGVVVDEYGLHKADIFSTVLRPALADRGGWALFLGTPNGKNQFYDIIQYAREQPDWFEAVYRASATGILSLEELVAARAVMTQDEYDQEFECSFEAAVKGAIYSEVLQNARAEGRVTSVPYDPMLPVDTDWDLGIGDSMAIWFSQSSRSGEVRLIDYEEGSGEGFPYYARLLSQKGYAYGTHWAPHDIAVRELGSGKSRLEIAAGFGLTFQVTPRINSGQGQEVEEGIHAARLLIPRCWFDEVKCKVGLEALQHYRRDYNSRLNEFTATPVHDWACVTGDTKVLTRSGTYQIQYLPAQGEVLTKCGWKPYENPRITRRAAPLVAVMFSDGLTVRCTPEHRFLTVNGWRFASDLQTGSLIQSCWTHSSSISTEPSTASGQRSAISRAVDRAYIAMSGPRRLVRFPPAVTSIIATATRAITRSRISNACLRPSIWQLVGASGSGLFISRPQQEPGPLRGTPQMPADCGIRGMPSGARGGRSGLGKRSHVSTAGRRWMRWCARLVTRRNTAPSHAKPLRIVSVKPLLEQRDVWCLTVPDGHMWSLENGAITHNSHGADAFRGLAVRHETPSMPRRQQPARPMVGAEFGWMS